MNLTAYVRSVSLEDFGLPFCHQAVWNGRLRSTGGRFFAKDGHLDFNPHLYEVVSLDIFRKIVRHELCHYHLYFQGKGYRHRDKDFKELLAKVDGLRYAPRLSQSKRYYYTCQSCQAVYGRRRRVDVKKYRCGVCRGILRENSKNQP